MHKQILLTGATGALGPALAADLARHAAADRIAILMRSEPHQLAERFTQWLALVRPLLPAAEHHHLSRLHPVAGDIVHPHLGLGTESDPLRQRTDVVIHAAADTDFSAPHDRQWTVNVEGTQRTLDWARACPKLTRFLLVSSVFVSGSRTGRIDEAVTTSPPDFTTHYQRTKWESEHLALQSDLPLAIARISLVLGSHATGGVYRPGAVHSLIKWFARGLIPFVPGLPDARGDLIATETAAQCLSRAVMGDWPTGTHHPIWHIAAGTHAPRMIDLMNFVYDRFAQRPAWARRHIPRPTMIDQSAFNSFIDSVATAGRTTLAQTLRAANRFLPELGYPKTYDTTQAEALWGGPLPQYDWRETMDRVIHFTCPPRTST